MLRFGAACPVAPSDGSDSAPGERLCAAVEGEVRKLSVPAAPIALAPRSGPLSPGQRVVVRAVEGLRVRVEPVGPAAVAPAAPRSSHRPRWAGLCLWGAASALSLFALESPTLVVLGVPLASLIALAGLSLLGSIDG